MTIPLNSIMFSGFGDGSDGTESDQLYKFTDLNGVEQSYPVTNPQSGGSCIGFTTCSDGCVFHTEGNFGPLSERMYNPDFSVRADFADAGVTQKAAADEHERVFYLTRVNLTTDRILIKDLDGNAIGSWDVATEGSGKRHIHIAVNQAGTIAYIARDKRDSATSPYTVWKVDLTTGVKTSFVTTTNTADGFCFGGILVLGDDSVIVGWGSRTAAQYPIRYSAAGSVLNTYNALTDYPLTGETPVSMAYLYTSGAGLRPRDDSRFLLSYYSDAAGYGVTVVSIDVASGAILTSFDAEGASGFEWDGPLTVTRLGAAGPTIPITPPTTLVNSAPSCATPSPGTTFAGDINPVGPNWTPSCTGSGVVPSASDIALVEAWDF